MSIIRGDASEIYELARDFTQISARAIPAARTAMQAGGKAFETAWRNDAHALHDSHAKFYPDSIDSELTFSVSSINVDVGPNTAKKQGFLGKILEFGGERSPAYMTGLKALDRSEAAIEKAVTNSVDSLFDL